MSQPKNMLAHRLVAESFVDNPNNFLYVRHKDGNLQNNHATNLEWVESGGDQVMFTHPRYKGITEPSELTQAYQEE